MRDVLMVLIAGLLWAGCQARAQPEQPKPAAGSEEPRPEARAQPAEAGPGGPSREALEARAAELRRNGPEVPGCRWAVRVEAPFVVVTNGSERSCQRWAEGTIRGAIKRLRARYFSKHPSEVITIWLLVDRVSYQATCRALTGDEPGTPYGFYSPTRRLMLMNIATGGGTLVHEIVHPYVRANFPDAPAWLNEGLGSLYEQSSFADGDIKGLVNWRLRGLKRAIAGKQLPTVERLCALSDDAFYARGRHRALSSGNHYAMARYLLLYLQGQGKLKRFYHAYHAARKDDPTGYATLRATLGEEGQDMAAFQRSWERWASGLSYR